MVEVFGEAGKRAHSAVGMAAFPATRRSWLEMIVGFE
jgi:hypothetical protein